MQPDIIEQLGNSTIQHGQYNDRIYVMKVADGSERLPQTLKELAGRCGYSKIFVKTPERQAAAFLENGFQCEAQIPDFFDGREAVHMLSFFMDEARKQSQTPRRNEQVMAACHEKRSENSLPELPAESDIRICQPDDADRMAAVYGEVFPTYPFPIDDPAYIRETMASHVVYFGVWIRGELAALSSSEMDTQARNAEMTDFATLPSHRGQGLAAILLDIMEDDMRRRNIVAAYTIARAPSFGMNITFAKRGYHFGGRLINNTNIGGQFEDMNVWYKTLQPPKA